ncbi:phage terminase small subunit [Ochrobactrum sp. RH1CCR137]|nr:MULTISPECIES: terminase small subunit [unclassified Ochrobactrum]MBA8846251.1 phage terminase small subunit [Ochrobactrum sp. RH1CCR137]MBA8858070.1 phage terminase small subunit [Ochrobactrum sp. RH1CCR134]
MSLTPKQERFVAEYLIDLNATQAAIRAGYSQKTAQQQGSRLLLNVLVQEAIAKGQNKTAAKLEITKERIVEELAKIGFSNMLDYMRAGTDGDPYLDFSNLTREQAAALAEVTVEDFKDGRGEDARDVRRIKFKLHDKKGALVDMAKMLGFMIEKHEHSGPDGGPIQTETRTWREVLRSEKR